MLESRGGRDAVHDFYAAESPWPVAVVALLATGDVERRAVNSGSSGESDRLAAGIANS